MAPANMYEYEVIVVTEEIVDSNDGQKKCLTDADDDRSCKVVKAKYQRAHRGRRWTWAVIALLVGLATLCAVLLGYLFHAHDDAPMLFTSLMPPSQRTQFSTSSEGAWTLDQITNFEYWNTPVADPNLDYYPRVVEQSLAEMANGEEEIRYLANVADIAATAASNHQSDPYVLLIRVFVTTSKLLDRVKRRWDDTLDRFVLPKFVVVRVEYVVQDDATKMNITTKADATIPLKRMFALPTEPTDWIFVVIESTYVHISRLIHRLFADIDPTKHIRKGLLMTAPGGTSSSVPAPLIEAGIVFTRLGLAEMWAERTSTCWDGESISDWSTCLWNRASLKFSSLPGLNSISGSEMMKQALEGTLFRDERHMYDSVSGPVQGTARLPITYGNMSDQMFYDQLAVDNHHGGIPKIL